MTSAPAGDRRGDGRAARTATRRSAPISMPRAPSWAEALDAGPDEPRQACAAEAKAHRDRVLTKGPPMAADPLPSWTRCAACAGDDPRFRRQRDSARTTGRLRAAARADRGVRQRRHAVVRAAAAGAVLPSAASGSRTWRRRILRLKERQPFKAYLEHDMAATSKDPRQAWVVRGRRGDPCGHGRGRFRRLLPARGSTAPKHPGFDAASATSFTRAAQVELLRLLARQRVQDLRRFGWRARPDAFVC